MFGGDLRAALGAITARAIIMPSSTDLYFPVRDSEIETAMMPDAQLRPIISDYGHRAGNPSFTPADEAFIRDAVNELLG
jgi:homoserine O-acetyltransferase